MIAICEPLSKSFEHEKFNSAFVHGLRLAYPKEKILFYAASSHIIAVKHVLKQANITIENIEYIPIGFRTTASIAAFIRYYLLFNRIFTEVLAAESDKLLLLSFTSNILYLVKKLKEKQKFKSIKLALVCHGLLEDITNDSGPKVRVRRVSLLNRWKSFIEKVRQTSLTDIPDKIIWRYHSMIGFWKEMFRKRLALKKRLLWRHSSDFKYIILSPHIIANAKKYIDVESLNFHTVILPTIFADQSPDVHNKYVKFAIIGQVYPATLQEVLSRLSLKQLNSHYEIRMIGVDAIGTKYFPNITYAGQKKQLSREEIDKYVLDIDIFLIVYDKNLYKLSCSGVFFEALSYVKPILYLDNDCINAFNKKENPIGIHCDTVDSMADTMADIINNYPGYGSKLREYRNNILSLRKQVAIENNLKQLRDSFTWV